MISSAKTRYFSGWFQGTAIFLCIMVLFANSVQAQPGAVWVPVEEPAGPSDAKGQDAQKDSKFENRGVEGNVTAASGEDSASAEAAGASSGNLEQDGYNASVSAGKAEAGYGYNVGGNADGVGASGNVNVGATVVEGEVKGQTSTEGGGLRGSGSTGGYVGGKAEASGDVKIGTSGVKTEFEGEAFVGAKGEAEVCGGGSCFGVDVNVTVEGDVRAGAGGEVKGNFTVSGGKIIIKGKLAGALGVGAGVGASIEIDVSGALDTVKGWWDSYWNDAEAPPPSIPDTSLPPQTSADPFGDNTGVSSFASGDSVGRDIAAAADVENESDAEHAAACVIPG